MPGTSFSTVQILCIPRNLFAIPILLGGDATSEADKVHLTANPQVYVYYELDRYYQNHKRYVRSRDDSQTGSGSGGSSKCAPQQYVNGAPDPSLPHNGEINPCGLIAWSFFNDSYTANVVGPDGVPVPLELDVRRPLLATLPTVMLCAISLEDRSESQGRLI